MILLKECLIRNIIYFLSPKTFVPLVLSSTSSQMTKNVKDQPFQTVLTFLNSFENW